MKLTPTQERDIVKEYAFTDSTVHMEEVAKKFGCSRYIVQKTIRKYIENCLVKRSTAVLIVKKADLNARKIYANNNSAQTIYQKLLCIYDGKIRIQEELLQQNIKRLNYLRNEVNIINESYFPLDDEDLVILDGELEQIEFLKLQIEESAEYIKLRIF